MAARNAAVKADVLEPAVVMSNADTAPPGVDVPGDNVPVRQIDGSKLRTLGLNLTQSFNLYRSDRRIQELRWLKNLRQYLGYYDPEVEATLAKDRSRSYPKITRVKCISMLARVIDLMFPSDDRNWTLNARPSADMNFKDVKAAIEARQQKDAAANNGQPPQLTEDYVTSAVTELAQQRAQQLMIEIDDQLQELGGDQTYDYIQLNCEVVASAVMYGIGLLRGPFVRRVDWSTWKWDSTKQQPLVSRNTRFMPQFEFMSVWDFYPDFSAKRIEKMDGYFERRVLGKKELLDLADDESFFGKMIERFLSMNPRGNYKAQEFETDLRGMGVKVNVNEQKAEAQKYEVIIWHGMIDAVMLEAAGCSIPEDKRASMIDSEVWLLGDFVIKAVMNPWAELGTDVRTLHAFLFDRDDTAPIGFGLPNILRDTQMSISAGSRMLLDNASVVCGPILEMNTNLLRGDQDLGSVRAYRVYYRDDDAPTAQFPAIREIKVESHIDDLERIIELYLKFADIETFVGPMTGGDMSKMPSEPMRNLAGASMLMGTASLPFKQVIRNYDNMTRSVIQSLVQFNRQFNADVTPEAEYDVVARGATSLIAKEVRGMQIDQLATTLKPEEMIHVDTRKLVAARFRVRDLEEMLVSEDEAARRQSMQDQAAALDRQLQQAGVEANTRNLLAQAFKNIAQGQKNQMGANAEAVNLALAILEKGAAGSDAAKQIDAGPTAQPDASATGGAQPGGQAPQADPGAAGQSDVSQLLGTAGAISSPSTIPARGMPAAGLSFPPGAG